MRSGRFLAHRDAVGNLSHVHGAELSSLSGDSASIHLQAIHTADDTICAAIGIGCGRFDPRVAETLVNGKAPLGLDEEHRIDQITYNAG
jgi:hypothetical protein